MKINRGIEALGSAKIACAQHSRRGEDREIEAAIAEKEMGEGLKNLR